MRTGLNCQSTSCLFDICLDPFPISNINVQENQVSLKTTKKNEKISLKQNLICRKSYTQLSRKNTIQSSQKQIMSNRHHYQGSFKASLKQGKSTSYGDGRMSMESFYEKGNNLVKQKKCMQKGKHLMGSKSHQIQPLFSQLPRRDYYRIKSFTQRASEQQKKQKAILSQQILISIIQPEYQIPTKNLEGLTIKQPSKIFLNGMNKKLHDLNMKLEKSRSIHNDYDTITSLLYSSDMQERISQSTVHIDFFNPSQKTFSHLQSHAEINSTMIVDN